MSRASRYMTIGLIWIFAFIIHWFGATLFAPETMLWGIGEAGVGTYIDTEWRLEMYRIFVQYIPLLFVGLSLLWGFAKEYEDAVRTGVYR